MKSIRQRREELKRRRVKDRLARVKASAVPVVATTIVINKVVVSAIIPQGVLGGVVGGIEPSLVDGDTLLREFKKIRLTNADKRELRGEGFVPLSSSNIAGARVDGNDLILKFHSGEEYIYPGKANFLNRFAEALSPGRLLWRTIRFARGYRKI